MTRDLRDELNDFGFVNSVPIVDEAQIEILKLSLSRLSDSVALGSKSGKTYGIRNLLNLVPEVRELSESEGVKNLIKSVLGSTLKPVKAIYFDKSPKANWKVPWHQDLTISVKHKIETPGFSAWTTKAEILHVQPPVNVLEKMVALRIHLDDTDETNGALRILPETHKHGRLSSTEIQEFAKANNQVLCCIKRGDGTIMRPLLIHASSAGTEPKHRRVIHIEYSAENLPNGLEWNGS
jgi:Phytanoyl-CoA dioxygenase (PhyH)